MLLSLFLLCTTCTAEDASVSADTAQQVEQQVDVVTDRLTVLGAKLAAIERMLADQKLVEAGLAPKDWVQPDLEAYLAPGAPTSFIPLPALPTPEVPPPSAPAPANAAK